MSIPLPKWEQSIDGSSKPFVLMKVEKNEVYQKRQNIMFYFPKYLEWDIVHVRMCQERSSIDIFNRCSNFNSQNLISSPTSFKDIGAREIKYKKSHLCGQVWYDPVCWFWIRVIRQHITLSRPITRVLNRRQFSSAHILSGHIFHPPCSSVVEDQATASPANSTTLPHLPKDVSCRT